MEKQHHFPTISNIRLSATYSSADTQSLAGGDWYDAFELPQGGVMFSIGDAVGHGIEASMTMSRARQAIIGAALGNGDPGFVLARANETLMTGEAAFATAICGYIDPGTLELNYATAGHPSGIFMDKSGVAKILPHNGAPLGVEHGSCYPTFKLTVSHDSLLILFTDGLLEYDHDIIEGERRLLEVVNYIGVQRLANPARAIMEAILKRRKAPDDVAILTIAFRDCPMGGAKICGLRTNGRCSARCRKRGRALIGSPTLGGAGVRNWRVQAPFA